MIGDSQWIEGLLFKVLVRAEQLINEQARSFRDSLERWLAFNWPTLMLPGWEVRLNNFLSVWRYSGVALEHESAQQLFEYLRAQAERMRREGVQLPERPVTFESLLPTREQAMRPAAERHFPDDLPSPFDPEYPQLRRTGNGIMQRHPPEDWLQLAERALKSYRVPEEIGTQFVRWIEAAQQAIGVSGNHPPAQLGIVRIKKGLTEQAARAILITEIARWRGNGWNFAANLLQHFVDKKGPRPYTPTGADTDEVSKESEIMVENVIYRAIWDDKARTVANLQGAPVKFSGTVRWIATGLDESIAGSIYTGSGSLLDANNDLFYGFGGANVKLAGTVTKLGTIMAPVKSYIKFDVKAVVAVTDNYTFTPTGPLGSRLWISTYEAANFLETKLRGSKYKPFTVSVSFERTYTGLRTDKIAGGRFHVERPLRAGDPTPPPYE